jgi:hypothetical protein
MCTARNLTPTSFDCVSVPAISFATRSRPKIGFGRGGRLTAAVAVDDDVSRKHLLQRREVAAFGRGEEALDELVALLP